MWKIGEAIGDKEGRMDACIAAAGILKPDTSCLEYPASQYQEVSVCAWAEYWLWGDICLSLQVMNVNVNGVLYTAQAAGRQMERFGNGGSIILVASMSGSITNKVHLALAKDVSPFCL